MNLLQKFNRWDEHREQKYLLGRWVRVRAKGKLRFVLVENLERTLILTICLAGGRWISTYGFDVRAIFSPDILLYTGIVFIVGLILNSFLAEHEWNSTEKRYRKLKESQDSIVLIDNSKTGATNEA
jgi:hypothetical protein